MKQLSLFDLLQIPNRAAPTLEIGSYIEDTHAARRGRILRTKDLYVGMICLLNKSTESHTWSLVVKIVKITDTRILMTDGRKVPDHYLYTQPEYVDRTTNPWTLRGTEGTLIEAIPN